jgi:hypothetical protein
MIQLLRCWFEDILRGWVNNPSCDFGWTSQRRCGSGGSFLKGLSWSIGHVVSSHVNRLVDWFTIISFRVGFGDTIKRYVLMWVASDFCSLFFEQFVWHQCFALFCNLFGINVWAISIQSYAAYFWMKNKHGMGNTSRTYTKIDIIVSLLWCTDYYLWALFILELVFITPGNGFIWEVYIVLVRLNWWKMETWCLFSSEDKKFSCRWHLNFSCVIKKIENASAMLWVLDFNLLWNPNVWFTRPE